MHKLAGILGKKWYILGTRKALSQPLIRMYKVWMSIIVGYEEIL